MSKPQIAPPVQPTKPSSRIRLKSVEFVAGAMVASNLVERITDGWTIGAQKVELHLDGGFVVFGDYMVPLSNVRSMIRA